MSYLPQFRFQSAAHRLTVAIIAASILQGFLIQMGALTGDLWDILLFVPSKVVYQFQLWRPFSALFVESYLPNIILGSLIVYGIGGSLEGEWGPKRFLTVALGIPLLANILMLPILWPVEFAGRFFCVSSVVVTIWIAFGLRAHFWGTSIAFWGIPIQGKTFALIGLAFPVLQGLSIPTTGGFLIVLPQIIAAGLTYAYMYKPSLFAPFALLTGLLQRIRRSSRRKRGDLKVVTRRRFDDDDYSGHQIH